jgi:hypothetical protein
VRGEALDRGALAAQPPVQLEREEQVRQLRLSVGVPAEVATIAVEIVERDAAHLVRGARERHDSGILAPLHQLQQERGQQEVAEVVGAELKLEAVGRPASRRRHHAGVIDQQVEPVVGRSVTLGEAAHRLQAREVELLELHLSVRDRGADLLDRGVSLVEVATGHHHGRPGACQLPRRHEPESAVGASDDRVAPGLVRDVLGGPAVGHGLTLTGGNWSRPVW